ncbi:GntR family transcriptional regulator [Roseateles chitinivorans]|uniref:GntR family transcriptional regulator n=1 Tax=Roseateles chitinivorans TaxID=2917965 RepID=UPI003D66FFD3
MDASDPLYAQVAAHYRQAIAAGTMPPGSRMPSVRTLMGLHRVSLSTALQACRLLESQGLLQARQRAGYFVRPPRPNRLARAAEPRETQADPARFVGVHERISEILTRGINAKPEVNLSGACAHPRCIRRARWRCTASGCCDGGRRSSAPSRIRRACSRCARACRAWP